MIVTGAQAACPCERGKTTVPGDKVDDSISDNELLIMFKKVEKFPAEKKRLVKEFLDSFLFKDNVQQQLAL